MRLDDARFERAAELLIEAIDRNQIGAASLTVWKDGDAVYERGFGVRAPGSSEAVKPDSVFLLASISKPISVCGLMLLVERGQVGLNDPVQKHLPEFEGEHKGEVTVRHLLSHTSGMPDMLPENVPLREAHTPMPGFVDAALKTPLLYRPGTDFRYQSKGILLATEIVRRIDGRPFRDFLRDEIFEPAGMSKTSLGLGGRKIEETVWCGLSEKPETDWDANSSYWRDAGQPWGGVHSTGPDLARLLKVFLEGGQIDGRRLFGAATVQAMTRNQNTHLQAPWGLGWGLRDSLVWTYFGDLCSPRTFGHVGATGTVAWADPDTGLSCVVLTNLMVEDGHLLNRVSNVVASAVGS